jgi:hypothetical protein
MGYEIADCLLVKLFALHTTAFQAIFPQERKPHERRMTMTAAAAAMMNYHHLVMTKKEKCELIIGLSPRDGREVITVYPSPAS